MFNEADVIINYKAILKFATLTKHGFHSIVSGLDAFSRYNQKSRKLLTKRLHLMNAIKRRHEILNGLPDQIELYRNSLEINPQLRQQNA